MMRTACSDKCLTEALIGVILDGDTPASTRHVAMRWQCSEQLILGHGLQSCAASRCFGACCLPITVVAMQLQAPSNKGESAWTCHQKQAAVRLQITSLGVLRARAPTESRTAPSNQGLKKQAKKQATEQGCLQLSSKHRSGKAWQRSTDLCSEYID